MLQSLTYSAVSDHRQLLAGWIDRVGITVLCLLPMMMFLGTGVIDIGITAISVFFVGRCVLLHDYRCFQAKWLQVAFLLWGFLLIKSCFAFDPKLSFKEAAPFIRFALFAAAMQFWLLRSAKHRHWLVMAIGVACIFIVVNTFFAYISGLNLTGRPGIQNGPHHWYPVWQRLMDSHSYRRLQGINGKLNTGTIMTWMCFPFIVLLMQRMHHGELRQKIFSALGIVGILLAVMLTGERMALLEVSLGFVLLFLLFPQMRRSFLQMAGLFVLCFGLMMLNNPHIYHRMVFSVYQQTAAIFHQNVYGGIFNYALTLFYHHPVTGVGLKQFQVLCRAGYETNISGCNSHAQNVYLEWLSGGGIIGIVLFLSMIMLWFKRFWQQRALLLAAPIAIGALVDVILRLWPFASTTSFFFSWGAVGFWLMAGFVLAYLDDQEPQVKEGIVR